MVLDLAERTERKTAALYAIALIAIASVPSLLSYSQLNLRFLDVPVLDYLDGTVVVIASPLVALIMVLILGWKWKNFEKESGKVVPAALLRPYILLVRFFIPVALIFSLCMILLSMYGKI